MNRHARYAATSVAALALSCLSLLAACSRDPGLALRVSAEDARACDVLVDVGAATAPTVDFTSDVRGASSHHGARLGISWVAESEHAPAAAAATLHGAPAPKLLTSTCYDRDGHPIANPHVTLVTSR
jgi:hypothetical protein